MNKIKEYMMNNSLSYYDTLSYFDDYNNSKITKRMLHRFLAYPSDSEMEMMYAEYRSIRSIREEAASKEVSKYEAVEGVE